ncbi:MAG TPA: gliding motility-associated C-terminal domain-containing protein [Bacteroidia bacterium]|jgi:gliding motility-associated-like protein|nr:gliding motility-associated C-terminal domain-containing protein [Bacteroidia bacterium]
MKRNILPLFASLLLVASTIYSTTAKAQDKSGYDPRERIIVRWNEALENTRLKYGASEDDFGTFTRFDLTPLELLKIDLIKETGKVTDPIVIESILKEGEKKIGMYYEKFLDIKKAYPTSVAEYESHRRVGGKIFPCDSSGCTNMSFDDGTFNTWYGSYGINSSGVSRNITGVSWSLLGAVTEACNDPSSMAQMNGSPYFAGITTDYQLSITSSGTDYYAKSVSRVSPFGGKHSAMVGDSNFNGQGWAGLAKTFFVTPSNANLTYQYAVFLENPPGHSYYDQPFFTVAVLDELGDTIPNCGVYNVVSGPGLPGFVDTNITAYDGSSRMFYRPWTIVNLPLKHYINQCVTILFEAGDCSLGGHFGYAYVSSSCSPYGLISSSPNLCGQKTITLTAPPGATSYTWTGPPGNSIVGSNTTQIITIDSSGTYQVILTPVTGVACNDTLQITVGKAPGPPPKPSFSADTVCLGHPTQFTNLSNPIGGGAQFYWDFYNIGINNDTVDVNPQWTYAAPGVYTVKLQETYHGCGYDTIIKIKVDSIPLSGFTATKECVKVPVTFTNTSSGATKGYLWNFGDPSSGTADTSTVTSPTHTFDTAGTYTVMLISKNPLCSDTLKEIVKVYAIPVPTIAGTDSICPGGSATMNAGGGISYNWSNGATSSSITVFPPSTTTYTVTVSNGTCSKDTTWTVHVKPVPVVSITSKPDTICKGDSATLTAKGGGTYIWTFSGSPDSTIRVGPTSNTCYTVQVTGKDGCTATSSICVTVINNTTVGIGVRNDSICPYDSTYFYATGGLSYKWLPSGVTLDSIKAKSSNTTGTCVITNACGSDTLTVTLHLAPVPVIKPKGATICKGSSSIITASGGTKYSWTPGTGLSCNNCGSPMASPTVTTVYTVTVSNGKCSKDSVVTVTVNPIPDPGVTPPQKICACKPTPLTATGGGTYVWSTGATTSSITVSPCVDSTYKVTVSVNGCDSSKTTIITVSTPSVSVCCPGIIVKDSSGPVTLTAGGSGNFVWSPNNGSLNYDTGAVVIASPTVTTTYTVCSTNSSGCEICQTVVVDVEIPCADFKVPNVFTPNNDGRNDDFVINVLNPTTYSIVIYDRWGKEVYTSSDPTVYWTGHLLTTQYLVPDGVYYYIIKSTCGSNNYTKDGFVQVIGGN